MFVGRVGTITVATALALGERERPYRYPEENPDCRLTSANPYW